MAFALAESVGLAVRPALASDYQATYDLIHFYAQQGEMLPVNPTLLMTDLPDFIIAEDDRGFAGCARLHLWHDGTAEIRSLAVRPHSQGLGIGRALVEQLERRAQTLKQRHIFALTLKPMFFMRLNYEPADRSIFPAKIAGDCQACPTRFHCREVTVHKRLSAEGADRLRVWDWMDV